MCRKYRQLFNSYMQRDAMGKEKMMIVIAVLGRIMIVFCMKKLIKVPVRDCTMTQYNRIEKYQEA